MASERMTFQVGYTFVAIPADMYARYGRVLEGACIGLYGAILHDAYSNLYQGKRQTEPRTAKQVGAIIGMGEDTVKKYVRLMEQYNILRRIACFEETAGGYKQQIANAFELTLPNEWAPPPESNKSTPTEKIDTPPKSISHGAGKKSSGGGRENLPDQFIETGYEDQRNTAAAAVGHSASASVGARGASARPKASPPAEGVAAAAAQQAETMVVTTTASLPATSTPAPLAANALAATMQGGTTAQAIADAGESEGGPSLEEMLGWSDEDEGQAASPPRGAEAPPVAGASPSARAETPDEHRQKYTESLDDATRETLRAMCAKLKGYKGFSNRVVIDLFEATGMDLMRQGADVLAATAEFCGTYGREGRGCTKGTPTAMLMGFWRRRTSAMFTPPARPGEKGGGKKGGERQYTPLAEAGVATNAVSMDARMAAWKKAQAGTGVSIPTP